MEMVIALLAGAAGGTLISGISPKISISLWLSLLGGMVGGAGLFLAYSAMSPPIAGSAESSVNLVTLVGLMSIGFAGGVLSLGCIFLVRWRVSS